MILKPFFIFTMGLRKLEIPISVVEQKLNENRRVFATSQFECVSILLDFIKVDSLSEEREHQNKSIVFRQFMQSL